MKFPYVITQEYGESMKFPYVITQECGQKWYRWRSWFKYCYPINTIWDQIGTPNFRIRKIWEWEYTMKPGSHKLVGFAIGPIMFFKKEYYVGQN